MTTHSDPLLENLQIAAFDGIEFPCTESGQDGARRVTEHEAWRRDGAELTDGGRKAYRGRMTAMCINGLTGWGDLFPDRAAGLILRFETGADGEMRHPLLGNFTAVVTAWSPRTDARVRNGIAVDFDWIEQRASSVGIVGQNAGTPTVDARADMVFRAGEADRAVTAATGASPPVPLSPLAEGALADTAQGPAFSDLGRVLAGIGAGVSANTIALSRVPVTRSNAVTMHAARASLFGVTLAMERMRAEILPDPARERFLTPSAPMTFAELSMLAYGTPTRARDLRAANAIATDTVPPGVRVRVLP